MDGQYVRLVEVGCASPKKMLAGIGPEQQTYKVGVASTTRN